MRFGRLLVVWIVFSFCLSSVSAADFTIKEKDSSEVYFKIDGSTGNVGVGADPISLYTLYLDGVFSSDSISINGNIGKVVSPIDRFSAESLRVSTGGMFLVHIGSSVVGDPYNWLIKLDGSTLQFFAQGATGGSMMELDKNGNLWINGAYYCFSDIRLKKDVRTIDNALDKVMALQGVSFRWKNSSDDSLNIGLIAQDVEKIVPEVVATNPGKDGGIKGIAYSNMVALLIEATKEQQTNINQIKEVICEHHPAAEVCQG